MIPTLVLGLIGLVIIVRNRPRPVPVPVRVTDQRLRSRVRR